MKLTKHKRLSYTHTHKEIHIRDLKKSEDNLITKEYNPLTFRLFPADLIIAYEHVNAN